MKISGVISELDEFPSESEIFKDCINGQFVVYDAYLENDGVVIIE